MNRQRVLYVVACGASPAAELATLVDLAHDQGWYVSVVATPDGYAFLDAPGLQQRTGHPVRTAHRAPGGPRRSMPPADAIVVVPATFNTMTKLAAGIADNYALSMLAECIGLGVPVVVVPFINTALASRSPLQTAVARLRGEGVHVLFGPNQNPPHPPGQGGAYTEGFPWAAALATATAALPDTAA